MLIDQIDGISQWTSASGRINGCIAESAPPRARTRSTLKQSHHMPRNVVKAATFGNPIFSIFQHLQRHIQVCYGRPVLSEYFLIYPRKEHGCVIGCPTDHHAVDILQVRLYLLEFGDTTVNFNTKVWSLSLQTINFRIRKGGTSRFCLGLKPFSQAFARAQRIAQGILRPHQQNVYVVIVV